MQTRTGMLRLILTLSIALFSWASCDPTDEKKKPEAPAEAEKTVAVPAFKGVLSDSLYTLVVDVATFGKFKNNVTFSLLVDTTGKISLVGWNPPFPKPGSATGTPAGVIASTDSAVAKISSAISINSLFLQDKKKIEDVIAKENGKFVVFVPNISSGTLNYDVYVSGAIPGPAGGTMMNFLMAPTGSSLNPSPPYSNQ